MNPKWYPGYYLDPQHWPEWMPEVFPHWLPASLVRTPPEVPPASWPEPSSKPSYGLFDELPERLRPKSFEQELAALPTLLPVPKMPTPQPNSSLWGGLLPVGLASQPAPWPDASGSTQPAIPTAGSLPPLWPRRPGVVPTLGGGPPAKIAGWPDDVPRDMPGAMTPLVRRREDEIAADAQRTWMDAIVRSQHDEPDWKTLTATHRPVQRDLTGLPPKRPPQPYPWYTVPIQNELPFQRAIGGFILDATAGPFVDAYRAVTGQMDEEEQKDFALATGIQSLLPGFRVRMPRVAARNPQVVTHRALGQQLYDPPQLPPGPRADGPVTTSPTSRSRTGDDPLIPAVDTLRAEPGPPPIGRRPQTYDPPRKRARPFDADYPEGAVGDASGRLLTDMDGQPLTARYVVGRQVVGGRDVAFPREEYDALTQALTLKRQPPTAVPPSQMGNALGKTVLWLPTRTPVETLLRSDLPPRIAPRIHAHELGHTIEEWAGQIPIRGRMREELIGIYNTFNNPKRAPGGHEADPRAPRFTPRMAEYKPHEIPREYMAEAIRAYITDPNYIKTVAPKTAAAIRERVNTHPLLKRFIQFNTLAGLGIIPPLLAEDARAEDVPAPK